MRHLSPERLAAVADERPTPDEAAHLAQCGQCVDARDAYRRLIAGAARERERATAPLSSWGAISAQLRSEGIIRTPEATTQASATSGAGDAASVLPFARVSNDVVAKVAPVIVPATPEVATPDVETPVLPMRRRVVSAWAMRAAAALVLVTGGVMVGRASAGRASAPPRLAQAGDTKPLQPEPQATGFIKPVSNSPVAETPEYKFESTEEARDAMLRAEQTYQAAMKYLAQNDSTIRPPVEDPVAAYQQRLAKLDSAVAETRNALKVAPTNPVINNYYLASVNAREMTLRQIDEALPVNERVTRF